MLMCMLDFGIKNKQPLQVCKAVGESTHLGKGLAFLGATLALFGCGFKCDSDGSWTSVLICATKSLGIER